MGGPSPDPRPFIDAWKEAGVLGLAGLVLGLLASWPRAVVHSEWRGARLVDIDTDCTNWWGAWPCGAEGQWEAVGVGALGCLLGAALASLLVWLFGPSLRRILGGEDV